VDVATYQAGGSASEERSSIDTLSQLTQAVAEHVARAKVPALTMRNAMDHLEESSRAARRREFSAPKNNHGALVERALDSVRLDSVADIAACLRPVHMLMAWTYHYIPRTTSEDLGDRIAFAELIGPGGPMSAPHALVGFTVMAEQTIYPLHCHPAVELYLVICGVARWQTQNADRLVSPGEYVLHDSDESHAMQTFSEPMLALWSWSGDVHTPATYT
jgi:quercetin dioxygenase-like cupin family protein